MKRFFPYHVKSREEGVALVIVLAVVVLVTALVVGFLLRAGTDRTSTASYTAVVTTRQLADTVVNLVQAQINDATLQGPNISSNQGPTYAWASQPGAIRVFDDSGNLRNIYRLYSSSAMMAASTADLAGDVPPVDWASSPAAWVDLNAPVSMAGVKDSAGKPMLAYPIIDPRDPANPGTSDSPTVLSGTKLPGFYLGKSVPGGTLAGATDVPGATATQPVPMPVRWMYVLKDGTIVAPTSGGGNSVTVNTATVTNPIVGRIAFWTDDECCKVNLNTAAGSVSYRPDSAGNYPTTASGQPLLSPAPWDTPRFGGIWEDIKLFAFDQPVSGEYQRYPGHPASTILYDIFNGLGVSMSDVSAPVTTYTTNSNNAPNTTSTPTSLFQLLPRYNDDFGSNAGTANTALSLSPALPTPKASRLYDAVGELLYSGSASTDHPDQRQVNEGGNSTAITRQQVETGKFFLTAHSRGPEITLFGTPRIAMWPVPDPAGTTNNGVTSGSSVRSPFDQLIAFCSTTGTGNLARPYYFVRNNRASPTVDATTARNANLYAYLQGLASTAIPGYGGSFAGKYSTNNEMNQILTEMVDYIRCTNPYDHSFPSGSTIRYAPGSEIVPLQITASGTTAGLGRIYTISEVALQVICTADGNSALGGYREAVNPGGWKAPVSPVVGAASDALYASNLPERQFLLDSGTIPRAIDGSQATASTPANMAFPCNETLSASGHYVGPNALRASYTPLTPGQKKLQAMLIFEMASPMCGYDWMNADVRIKVAGSSGISIAGVNPFPSSPPNLTGSNCNGDGYYDASTGYTWNQNGLSTWGGLSGFRGMMNFLVSGTVGSGTTGFQANARYNGWSGRRVLVPSASTNTTDTMGSGTGAPNLSDAFVPLGSSSYYNVGTLPDLPYRPVSNPFTVSSSAGTMAISGGFTALLQVPILSGSVTFQTFNVSFANVQQPAPLPNLPQWGIDKNSLVSHAPDWWGFDNRIGWDPYTRGGASSPTLDWSCLIRTDGAASSSWSYKDTHATITSNVGVPADVVRSVFAKDGDYRLTAAKSVVNADGAHDFSTLTGTTGYLLHLLMDGRQGSDSDAVPGCDLGGRLSSSGTYASQWAPKFPSIPTSSANGVNIRIMGDWDNGMPHNADGAYANWPDDGNNYVGGNPPVAPYFNGQNQISGSTFYSYFTPNRIMPGPVMFGSLPTGVTEDISWRTLLFRPAINRPNDPVGGPPDYLLLDLFNMPVVEPYAISEPFSTAGKVNMNYQIVPFTYITRDTAVRAVLGSELVARIPAASLAQTTNNPSNYIKGIVFETVGVSQNSLSVPPTSQGPRQARLPLNLDEVNGTLRQFQDKFAIWDIFRSPAEICGIYLVPNDTVNPGLYKDWVANGPPYAAADTSWYGSDFAGVGDNVRERPYGDIYPRLTTKSNTFTVHYKVQSIKGSMSNPTQWNENGGAVLGEYRGSTTLERYLNPNNAAIPDYGGSSSPTSLAPIESFYKWRIISNTAFSP